MFGFFRLLLPQILSSSTHIALCLPDDFTHIATEGRGSPPSLFGGREVSFLLVLACCRRSCLLSVSAGCLSSARLMLMCRARCFSRDG